MANMIGDPSALEPAAALALAKQVAGKEVWAGSPIDREDAAQELLVRYFQQVGEKGAPQNPRAWMNLVLRNWLRDQAARREVAGGRIALDESDDLLNSLKALRVGGPSGTAMARDLLRQIAEVLTPGEFELISALDLDGVSAVDFADRVRRSPDAIRQAAKRARAKLRESVDDSPALQELLRRRLPGWYEVR